MRRAQAALEFLTTYGWALLVILMMIGAISYFGIVDPSKFVPSRCTTSPEFGCVDYKIDGPTDMVSLQLKQGVGKTIFFERFTCTYSDVTPEVSVNGQFRIRGSLLSTGSAWAPRDTVDATCDFLPTSGIAAQRGEKVKIIYELTYKLSSGSNNLNHTAHGEVYAEVQ